jgi:hypothetical protein
VEDRCRVGRTIARDSQIFKLVKRSPTTSRRPLSCCATRSGSLLHQRSLRAAGSGS